MSRSARQDAASFGVILFAGTCCIALVTGSSGVFWIMLAVIPVFMIAKGLDRR